MVGRYELAESYIKHAFNILFTLQKMKKLYSQTQQSELAALWYEAHNVAASRIAFEVGNMDKVFFHLKMALAYPDLPLQFKKLFVWQKGFYEYLEKDYSAALKTWSVFNLKDEKLFSSFAAKVSFWRAVSKAKLGQDFSIELDHLENGEIDSYYLVYAMNYWDELGLAQTNSRKPFSREGLKIYSLEKSEMKKSEGLLASFERTKKAFFRAKLLTQLKESSLLKQAFADLKYQIESIKTTDKSLIVDKWVAYLNLLEEAGFYKEQIRFVNKLVRKDPDMFRDQSTFVAKLYPKAYPSMYREVEKSEQVDPALLYAISRRESRFDPKVKSSAGAYGLMQLLEKNCAKVCRNQKVF